VQCNLIYRIPESNEVFAEERNKQDMSACEHFFNAFNVDSIRMTYAECRDLAEGTRTVPDLSWYSLEADISRI